MIKVKKFLGQIRFFMPPFEFGFACENPLKKLKFIVQYEV